MARRDIPGLLPKQMFPFPRSTILPSVDLRGNLAVLRRTYNTSHHRSYIFHFSLKAKFPSIPFNCDDVLERLARSGSFCSLRLKIACLEGTPELTTQSCTYLTLLQAAPNPAVNTNLTRRPKMRAQ